LVEWNGKNIVGEESYDMETLTSGIHSKRRMRIILINIAVISFILFLISHKVYRRRSESLKQSCVYF
jgi:hypothetical protein